MNLAETSTDALDVALREYLGWTGDPVATLKAAVAADPGFILGHTTLAALHSLGPNKTSRDGNDCLSSELYF